MLFLIGTLYDSDAYWTLAVASVPPVYTTSQLDEGILCVFLYWESLVMVRYSLPLMKGDRLNFVQPSKMPSRGNSLMSAAVTSLTIGTEMLAFVFDK